MPYFLVWSLSSSAWCIMRYTVCPLSCLLSFLYNPYIPFLIYEIFHLLVIIINYKLPMPRSVLLCISNPTITTPQKSMWSHINLRFHLKQNLYCSVSIINIYLILPSVPVSIGYCFRVKCFVLAKACVAISAYFREQDSTF